MANVFEMFKDYVIESEDDIPQKYREEIEKRLSSGENTEQTKAFSIISGKRGKVILEENKIEDIFKSEQDLYFGHGTTGGEEVINSILEKGLMTVDSKEVKGYMATLTELMSTAILFGRGTETLFSDKKYLLDNWPHKGSRDVIIISIPEKYALRNTEVGLADLYKTFYTGSEEKGYKLRPEFIKGIYNADTHTFTPNDNFYQNLEIEQQERLFNEIKQQYIRLYAEHSQVAPEKAQKPLPLNETELEQAEIEWYKKQLERYRKDKTFDSQMLDTELYNMSAESRISDFNDTTYSIRNDAQQEMEEDKENTDEGWKLDDWE